MHYLDRSFYARDSLIVAKELLGKYIVHNHKGKTLMAKIVETEAYMGIEDKAAHSYGGRRTPRVEVMYGPPGHVYVFLIYGMYNCFNVVTGQVDDPQAVLVRAVEPTAEIDQLSINRFGKVFSELKSAQQSALTNGPGKLCKGLAIDRTHNGMDLCNESVQSCVTQNDLIQSESFLNDSIQIAEIDTHVFEIVSSKRVGIDYAEEAASFPWRFYIKGNPHVSVKDKEGK